VALILVVEDDPQICELIKAILKIESHTVFTAYDGKAGVKLACQHQADLVIADLNMPEMDGIELTSNLRQMDSYKNAPILILTSETSAKKMTEARKAGASNWLSKPFIPPQLIAEVNKLL